jgi:hypothetical protein
MNPASELRPTWKLFDSVLELLPIVVLTVERPNCSVLILNEIRVEKVDDEEEMLSLISEKFMKVIDESVLVFCPVVVDKLLVFQPSSVDRVLAVELMAIRVMDMFEPDIVDSVEKLVLSPRRNVLVSWPTEVDRVEMAICVIEKFEPPMVDRDSPTLLTPKRTSLIFCQAVVDTFESPEDMKSCVTEKLEPIMVDSVEKVVEIPFAIRTPTLLTPA